MNTSIFKSLYGYNTKVGNNTLDVVSKIRDLNYVNTMIKEGRKEERKQDHQKIFQGI